MIAMSAALVLRSFRWVAPFVVTALWVLLVLADQGDALTKLSGLAPALLLWGIWLSLIAGRIDDDPHRDLRAAVAGSSARLHVSLALSTIAISAALVAGLSLIVATTSTEQGRNAIEIFATAISTLMAAVVVGTAIGSALHPPVVRQRGFSIILGTAGFVAVLIFPPTERLFRSLEAGDITWGLWAIAPAIPISTIAIGLTSQLAQRRAR